MDAVTCITGVQGMNYPTFYDYAVERLRFFNNSLAGELGKWIYDHSKYNARELKNLERRKQWLVFLKITGHDQLSFKALRQAWAMYERTKR